MELSKHEVLNQNFYSMRANEYEAEGIEMPGHPIERIKAARSEYSRRSKRKRKLQGYGYAMILKTDAEKYLSSESLHRLNLMIDAIDTGRQADGHPTMEKRW